jgi:hypothetical protein
VAQYTLSEWKMMDTSLSVERYLLIVLVVLGCRVANAGDNVAVVVDDPRPVAMAIQTLVSEYGYVITYEDPRYSFEGDLQDVTAQVRRDLSKYAPDKVPKVIGPLGGKLTLNVPPVTTSQDIASALNQLIQFKTGNGGHFRVQQTAGVFHVIPTEVRDVNGNWATNPSILDIPISMSLEKRTEYGTLDAICKAVGLAAHVNIRMGAGVGQGVMPDGDAPLYPLEASNESARSVLLRALASTSSRRRTWMLLYDFGEKTYFLSILGVPDLSSAAQQPQIVRQPLPQPVLSPADTVDPSSPK